MTTGSVLAAVTYCTQVIFSMMMITNMFQSISRAAASTKRIFEVLDTEPAVVGGEVKDGKGGEYAVEFKNVSFSYPASTGRAVLSDINLKIRRGETLAVIGATGVGKSSLVQMIPRFYDTSEGEVIVDGVPVKDYELSALRKKIGFVMQKSELFSDTIAGNIRWGDPDATDEEVRAAAEAAQASPFIDGFSEGYSTFIAEKGASLSGGQKQRTSIARAMLRRPEILILDDSTSALDLATEAKLRRSMRARLADTTVIMIAQRIASVQDADRIAVIESDGTIVHCAPHDELMEISETYRDIYSSQVRSGALITKNDGEEVASDVRA
jgi:ATP-binding cassette subfamily B protein